MFTGVHASADRTGQPATSSFRAYHMNYVDPFRLTVPAERDWRGVSQFNNPPDHPGVHWRHTIAHPHLERLRLSPSTNYCRHSGAPRHGRRWYQWSQT